MTALDDADRFRSLFEAQFSYVWGVLVRLGVRRDDVEDRVLEVFVKVHEKRADYDADRPIRPWLFGFAYRVASHARRTVTRRREDFGIDESLPDAMRGPEDLVAEGEQRTILARALEAIELERRAVIVMHDWDGEPVPEVARALGIPLNTAYSRLRVARQELAAEVKRLTVRDA